jgi:hypothetical protein
MASRRDRGSRPSRSGRTVIRTVSGLIEKTATSQGWPAATRPAGVWLRRMPPVSVRPALASEVTNRAAPRNAGVTSLVGADLFLTQSLHVGDDRPDCSFVS